MADTSVTDQLALLANPKELQARSAAFEKLREDAKKVIDESKLATGRANDLLRDANARDAEVTAKEARIGKIIADAASATDAASAATTAAKNASDEAEAIKRDYAARIDAVEVERAKLASATGDANNEELKFRAAIDTLKACIAGLKI